MSAENEIATSRLMALNEPISIVEPISPKSFNLMMILFLQMYPLVMMNIAIFMRISDYIFSKGNPLLSLVLVESVKTTLFNNNSEVI